MANRDILKEAIADAKAIKEAAIANAKVALEEQFTPYLKEKLSAKLAEIDEMDEEKELNETDDMDENEDMYEEKDSMDEEMDLDELLRELEDMEEVINDPKGQGAHGNVAPSSESDTDLMEAEDAETEEEFDIENMSENDLKSFIEDVISDMIEAGEIEGGHEGMEDEVSDEDEEIDLDEILAEMEDDDDLEEDLKPNAYYEKHDRSSKSQKLKSLKPSKVTDASNDAYYEKNKKMKEAMEDKTKKAKALAISQKYTSDNYEPNVKYGGKDDDNNDFYYVTDKRGHSEFDKDGNVTYSDHGFHKNQNKMKEELEEAYNTINKIKAELNEINLLNSKLLYSNKVFKAKNLTESQKIKVLAAFDKASTKKEAQLVYETVMENLNTQTTTKRPVTESVRGMASKVISGVSNNTKQPIIEVNAAFARMQQLAGIKK